MFLSSVARVRSGVLLFVLVFASAAAPYSCQGRRGTEAVGGRGGFPAVLELERSIPSGADLDILRSHDEIRHRSLLQRKVSQRKKLLMQQKDTTGVVNFPIDGSSDPYSVGFAYFLSFLPFVRSNHPRSWTDIVGYFILFYFGLLWIVACMI